LFFDLLSSIKYYIFSLFPFQTQDLQCHKKLIFFPLHVTKEYRGSRNVKLIIIHLGAAWV